MPFVGYLRGQCACRFAKPCPFPDQRRQRGILRRPSSCWLSPLSDRWERSFCEVAPTLERIQSSSSSRDRFVRTCGSSEPRLLSSARRDQHAGQKCNRQRAQRRLKRRLTRYSGEALSGQRPSARVASQNAESRVGGLLRAPPRADSGSRHPPTACGNRSDATGTPY